MGRLRNIRFSHTSDEARKHAQSVATHRNQSWSFENSEISNFERFHENDIYAPFNHLTLGLLLVCGSAYYAIACMRNIDTDFYRWGRFYGYIALALGGWALVQKAQRDDGREWPLIVPLGIIGFVQFFEYGTRKHDQWVPWNLAASVLLSIVAWAVYSRPRDSFQNFIYAHADNLEVIFWERYQVRREVIRTCAEAKGLDFGDFDVEGWAKGGIRLGYEYQPDKNELIKVDETNRGG